MATLLEKSATEEQRFIARFYWKKDSLERIFIKNSHPSS
jgi:hypothetical protein